MTVTPMMVHQVSRLLYLFLSCCASPLLWPS